MAVIPPHLLNQMSVGYDKYDEYERSQAAYTAQRHMYGSSQAAYSTLDMITQVERERAKLMALNVIVPTPKMLTPTTAGGNTITRRNQLLLTC